jgi:2-oxoglutarate ferredoxin oxidoreductase subunit delta
MAKGKLTFDTEKCKGCELCVTFCPKKILVLGKETNSKGYFPVTVTNMDECIACGTCAIMCPDSIITVEKE